MLQVAMITRSTLFSVYGGDTVQVMQTAKHLAELGIQVDIKLTNEIIDYQQYQLLHFFNITRPADILYHIYRSGKPFVISTILVDYSLYDKYRRTGMAGKLFRNLSGDTIEYVKTVARWILGKDRLMTKSYLWKGQRKSVKEILQKAAMLLPNSALEYDRIVDKYHYNAAYRVVPNGIDASMFQFDPSVEKDDTLVICVARIEGIKNQLNLVRALNGTRYRLLVIGSPAPNQHNYYSACKKLAADNVSFIDHMPQEKLLDYYRKARTHILPSWFETTGLSSLEAAAMGCNIVISKEGDAKEYFGNDAFYCDPASPESILAAVERASIMAPGDSLRKKINEQYTWQKAAESTLSAYQKVTGI
jgi:glycosyltransferase involved in cell wall biosynthesis